MISKKKLKEIDRLSVGYDILQEKCGNSDVNGEKYCFTDDPPEFWNDYDKLCFDLVSETEYELKKKILEILQK